MIKVKIEVYSHGVRITNYDEQLFNNLSNYIKSLTLREAVKIPRTKRFVMEERKRYYGLTENKKEFFIHKYCLDDFLEELGKLGLEKEHIDLVKVKVPEFDTVEYELDEKYVLRDYQETIKEDILRPLASARVDLQTGKGKSLRNGTPVKIPGGWKPVEELKLGDLVIGSKGLPISVNGIFPQGIETVCRLITKDRRVVDCGENHLWTVYLGKKKEERLVTTLELRQLLFEQKVYLPTAKPEDYQGYEFKEDLTQLGKDLGLGVIESIDDKYLNGSLKQKQSILNGLLSVVINPDFKKSANKYITYLTRSLQGYARSLENGEFEIDSKVYHYTEVKSVEFIGEYETTCISVNSDDKLFVVKDFIVTHNTLTSLATLAEMKTKLVVMIPPKYFGLWTKALEETYKNIEDRFLLVSGSKALKDLLSGKTDIEGIDVFLVSNVTYRNYIAAYEESNGDIESLGYNVKPFHFHEFLGVGCQINDEIQEDPGLLFRIDLFTNVDKQIYLSATPYTGNAFVTRMINKMLPEETKVRLPDLDVYMNCLGLVYNEMGIQPKDYITPFKNTYNHARYETRMLLKERRWFKYFQMVKKMVNGLYYKDRIPEQKLLILCSTVNFIGKLTEYLQGEFPDLQIGEHVSGSDYLKLLSNDITVSTIKSSGTGVDIPNLREVLLLQATDSKKDRIQILGRLRKLKDFPDVTPRLTYVICENIPQHMRYHDNSQKYFKDRIKSFSLKRISM